MVEIFNNDIVGKVLTNIYIALGYNGRNLHNISSLRAPCDEKNFTPEKLVIKFFKQNSRFEIMYSNIQQLICLLVKYNDASKFPNLNL